MTTMNAATAEHPAIGPINPPKESALRERNRGLFTSSKSWLCASAGTAGTRSTSDSRPMFMVVLGAATAEVARAGWATNDPGRTANEHARRGGVGRVQRVVREMLAHHKRAKELGLLLPENHLPKT